MNASTIPEAQLTLNGESYRLTFLDDFDGGELDLGKWSFCPEQRRQDAGGYWDNSQTRLDGEGNLVLSATIREDGRPISGAIRSIRKFEQRMGYFECRAKLQSAPGFWGAFWIMNREMNNNIDNNSARDGVEIDIFESNSVPEGAINHAIHWDGYGKAHKSTAHSEKNVDFYDGNFHTFGMLWDEDGYTFYIDGRQTWEVKGDVPGSCELPCYLKLSVEFGSWAGKPDPAQLPDAIWVDYVKVYERMK